MFTALENRTLSRRLPSVRRNDDSGRNEATGHDETANVFRPENARGTRLDVEGAIYGTWRTGRYVDFHIGKVEPRGRRSEVALVKRLFRAESDRRADSTSRGGKRAESFLFARREEHVPELLLDPSGSLDVETDRARFSRACDECRAVIVRVTDAADEAVGPARTTISINL